MLWAELRHAADAAQLLLQAQAQLHHTVQFGMQCAIICIGMKLHNNWPKISTFITLVFQNVQCFVHFIIFFLKISDFYRLFLDEFVMEITNFFLRYRLQVAWKRSRFITEPSQFVHCSYAVIQCTNWLGSVMICDRFHATCDS